MRIGITTGLGHGSLIPATYGASWAVGTALTLLAAMATGAATQVRLTSLGIGMA